MPLSEIADMTDRQMWELYLQPHIARQKKEREQQQHPSQGRRHQQQPYRRLPPLPPDDEDEYCHHDDEEGESSGAPGEEPPPPDGEEEEALVQDAEGRPMSGEAVLWWMVMQGFMRREDAERVIAEKQAAIAAGHVFGDDDQE